MEHILEFGKAFIGLAPPCLHFYGNHFAVSWQHKIHLIGMVTPIIDPKIANTRLIDQMRANGRFEASSPNLWVFQHLHFTPWLINSIYNILIIRSFIVHHTKMFNLLNKNVQTIIDICSVNGNNTVFYQIIKRFVEKTSPYATGRSDSWLTTTQKPLDSFLQRKGFPSLDEKTATLAPTRLHRMALGISAVTDTIAQQRITTKQ